MVCLLSACSYELTPYTQSLAKESQLNAEQLKSVQFYVSDDIVLYRYLDNTTTEIAAGTIKIIDGRNAEEIIIASGTPGVVVGVEKDQLLVSFDADNSYLRFAPNPGYGGRYTLMAKDWNGRTGVVDYNDHIYYTSGSGSVAHLAINLEQIDQTSTTTKQVSGRTIE